MRFNTFLYLTLLYFVSIPNQTTAAGLLQDGDDFSNNLVSDLAPLLALFGERVTTQFMSQSTGFADCITLAMAPIGVITIIISAIRVAGPRILKAVIGRARENIATVELEVMSSTSAEACELWNNQTRAVVRCPGTTDTREFICIYPAAMLEEKREKAELRVQVTKLDDAVNRAPGDRESSKNGRYHLLKEVNLKCPKINDPPTAIEENTIIITRNPQNIAPNMTLNCTADREHWQVLVCAGIGVIIQTGVLVFFGFLTEYKTLKFDKDGTIVEGYAMPMAVIGTLALNIGILICAFVVDESTKEETYEVIRKDSAAVALVWLQKEKNVGDQHFDSAAIYPTMIRHQACTSKRREGREQTEFFIMGRKLPGDQLWLQISATAGALITLLGFFVQFVGLRGMHWLATVVQLGAVIIMTVLRAFIRRHLATGLASHDLKPFTGFELEWFVASLLDDEGIPWVPGGAQSTKNGGRDHEDVAYDDQESTSQSSRFSWVVRPEDSDRCEKLSKSSESLARHAEEAFDLSHPQNILRLRRHLGELSEWHGPASKEALAVAQAIEKTMNFFIPYANIKVGDCGPDNESQASLTFDDDVSISTIESSCFSDQALETDPGEDPGDGPGENIEEDSKDSKRNPGDRLNDDSEGGGDSNSPDDPTISSVNEEDNLSAASVEISQPPAVDWAFRVDYGCDQQENSESKPKTTVKIKLQESLNNGWVAPVDLIDAALSLWLFSVKNHRIRDIPVAPFPCGSDQWMRGGLVQERRSLQILGPSSPLLLRDLDWWMPNSLNGILDAQFGQSPEEFPHAVRSERIGYSGERWPGTKAEEDPKASVTNIPRDDLIRWKWKPAERPALQKAEDETQEKTQNSCCRLVAKSEDPLHVIQAKELFASFLWALTSYIGHSAVGRKLQANMTLHNSRDPGSWKDFSLQNQQLSQFVQSIAAIGLWSEREVWMTIIPPLSATDNLPGLEEVIQLAQKKGVEQERNLMLANDAYRWLFGIGRLSLTESHIRVKSMAILWRYHERLRNSGNPLLSIRNREEIDRSENQHGQKLQKKVEAFFNFHSRLEHFKHRCQKNLSSLYYELPDEISKYSEEEDLFESSIYEKVDSPGDIFGRTHLHHVMQSNFIDHNHFAYGFVSHNEELRRELWHYKKCIAKSVKVASQFKLYPMRLQNDLHSSILHPFQTFHSLLQNGADPNVRDLDHQTPLHYACAAIRRDKVAHGLPLDYYCNTRDEERMEILLKYKAELEAQDLEGHTPLHIAVSSGRVPLVQFLISRGSDIQLSDRCGQTPLHLASKLGKAECISVLLDANVDIHARDKNSQTPLHLASKSGRTESIHILLKANANIHAEDRNDQTPLHLASMLDKAECISVLLNASADIHARDRNDQTPLHLASKLGRTESISVLIDANADINSQDRDRQTPLHLASMQGRMESISVLMDANADINSQDIGGQTPLHLATTNREIGSIKRLVVHGAKKHALNERGQTPLDIAISLGFLETFEDLYDNSILAEAIFTATRRGKIEAIDRLMEKMSDESWPPIDTAGHSPFYYASWYEQPGVILKIIKKERELNFRSGIILESKDTGSALCQAAWLGHLRVIQALAECLEPEIWGSLLELKDKSGRTPLFVSVHRKNPEAFSHLIDHGANVRFRTKNGRNLLHEVVYSSSSGSLDVTRIFVEKIKSGKWALEFTSMLGEKNEDGRTPQEVARWLGALEVEKLYINK